MAWFSKPKLNKGTQLFLSEFPSWAAIHSARLVNELQEKDTTGWADLLKNETIKSTLVDTFIGVHLLYLTLSSEGALIKPFFGEDIQERCLTSMPEKAKAIVLITLKLYNNRLSTGKDQLLSSLELYYGIKIDPIDAYIAFSTEQLVCSSKEFSGLIGGLLPTVHQLQMEQLEWLKEIVNKWSMNK